MSESACPFHRRPVFRPLRSVKALLRHPHHFIAASVEAGETRDHVTRLRSPRHSIYLFQSPEAIQDITVRKRADLGRGLTNNWLKQVMGNAFLTSEDEEILTRASLIRPSFSHERLEADFSTMVAMIHRRLQDWEEGDSIDARAEMGNITLPVMARVFLDIRLSPTVVDSISQAMQDVGADLDNLYRKLLPGSSWIERLPAPGKKRFRQAMCTLNHFVFTWVDDRIAEGPTGEDLLSSLVTAHLEDPVAFPRVQIRDEVMSLLFAGRETSSCCLAWTWHLLGQHPEVEANLHREIDETLQGGLPSREHLSRMKFLQAILNESLRLYPTAYAFGRYAKRDTEVDGHFVPKGSSVSICPLLSHRNPAFFSDPDTFDPNRWLREDCPPDRGAFYPFGSGPRRCAGEQFARQEMALILSMAAQKWRLKPTSPGMPEMKTALALEPYNASPMLLEKRV